jgi:hypothetical protein
MFSKKRNLLQARHNLGWKLYKYWFLANKIEKAQAAEAGNQISKRIRVFHSSDRNFRF